MVIHHVKAYFGRKYFIAQLFQIFFQDKFIYFSYTSLFVFEEQLCYDLGVLLTNRGFSLKNYSKFTLKRI